MQSDDSSHRPYRIFCYPSSASEDDSNHSNSSLLSPCSFENRELELRRPLRQAKIVFAEEFAQQITPEADEVAPGPNGHMASVFGNTEVDLFNEFLAKERDKESKKVVALAYENISPYADDNASESGIHKTKCVGSDYQEKRRQPAWIRWVLTLVVAAGVALQCSCMLLTEIHLTGHKLRLVEQLYWQGFPAAALALLLGYGLFAALISALLILYVSPRAASSGIPDTKAYLNGHHLPGFLSFKAWFARTFGLLLVTSAGLFAGSEGPLVAHLGAIISSGVARGRLRLCGRRLRMPWRLTGHRAQCEFVAIGTAMGVSAAFGSPVGGVLFSLEEVSSFWSNNLTWRAFFGSAIAALLAKGMKNGFGRKFLNSSFVEFPDAAADFQPWELLPIASVGVLTGVLGALFCRGCHMIGRMRSKIFTKDNPRRRLRVLEVLILAFFILLTCSMLPVAAGCRRLDASKTDSGSEGGWHVGDQARGHCREGEYSDMATLLMQPKHKAIKALFTKNFNGGAAFGPIALVSCCLIIFVFTLSANGMAMPYGLFVPHIMLGGCCGRAIGQLVQQVTGDEAVHPGVYALMGAAGQLAGISRMTVSLTMIMVEITSNMRLMLPLMLCVMVSKVLADRTGPSVFDVAIELNSQLHMLSGEMRESDAWGDNITVMDICSVELVVLHCKERVKHIVKLLHRTDYQAFPLVEGQKAHVVGVIHRAKLLCAISKETPSGSKAMIDLLPYANLTPEVKHWKTPVARVFTHFKSMGLSHLCVVDNHHGLVGFVTRSDMTQLGSSKGRKRLYEKLMKAVQLEEEEHKSKDVGIQTVTSLEQSLEQLVAKVHSHSGTRSKSGEHQGSSDGSSSESENKGSPRTRSEASSQGSPRMQPSRENSFHSGVSGAEVKGLAVELLLKAKDRELLNLRSENQQLRARLSQLEGEDVGAGNEDASPPEEAPAASSSLAPSLATGLGGTGALLDLPHAGLEIDVTGTSPAASSGQASPAATPQGGANNPPIEITATLSVAASRDTAAAASPRDGANNPLTADEASKVPLREVLSRSLKDGSLQAAIASEAVFCKPEASLCSELSGAALDIEKTAAPEASLLLSTLPVLSRQISAQGSSVGSLDLAAEASAQEGDALPSTDAPATDSLDLSIRQHPEPHSPTTEVVNAEHAHAAPAPTMSEEVEVEL